MADDKVQSVADGNVYNYDIYGTRYPYVNLKEGTINNALGSIRRSISGFNPFASVQIPSQDAMAIGPRWGNGWFTADPYPNGVHFEKLFPTHYNPTKGDSFQPTNWINDSHAPGNNGSYALTSDKLPKGCVRTIQLYRRCAMVNGEDKCREENVDVARICPAWALDTMREKNKFLMKVRAIQNDQYRKAMEVSSYNEGRTVADVADKTWLDGTREHLRPDTMWADQRYAKITQSEINEAKQRVQERAERKRKQVELEGHGHGEHADHGHGHGEHHHDAGQVEIQKPKRLYP